MNDFIGTVKEDAREWCQGKMWQGRLLLLVWMAYLLVKYLGNSRYWSLIDPLNLGIHEFGHMLFTPLGEFLHFLGGSLFQCMAPLIGAVMFYRQKDYFALFFAFGWLSTNLFYVATYVADARSMSLQLVSPFGGHAKHDWQYLLRKMGILSWDSTLAFLLRAGAVVSMAICLVGGGWILWEMFQSARKPH